MGGRNCCVKNCRRRSHDHHGRKIPNGLSFHCFPAWRQSEGAQTSELTRRRREAWVAAVGRSDITFDHVPASMRVCSRHFHSGNPAYEMLESDPDWVPSLHLGHGEGNGRRSKRFPPPEQSKVERRQRWTTERRHEARTTHRELGGGGTQDSLQTTDAARPTAPPWREVKSLLQSVLQSKTNETDDCAAAKRKKTELSFRDFFRDALEASLEASSRSRARLQRPPSVSEEYTVELNFTQNQTSSSSSSFSSSFSSSSSCLNCRRLQRRITELEEKLYNLEGQQEDTQTSPVASRAEVRQNQVLQSPEPVHKAEDETGWMEPLSPPHESDEDVDSASDSTPSSPGVFQIVWSKQRRRLPPRFNKAWLKTFWFLRYSADLDLMWCHVCRLHADKRHQNMALIKGSKMFKLDNIKKHRDSRYHKENMERHMLDVYELQL